MPEPKAPEVWIGNTANDFMLNATTGKVLSLADFERDYPHAVVVVVAFTTKKRKLDDQTQ